MEQKLALVIGRGGQIGALKANGDSGNRDVGIVQDHSTDFSIFEISRNFC